MLKNQTKKNQGMTKLKKPQNSKGNKNQKLELC